jgi:hypothetical protein
LAEPTGPRVNGLFYGAEYRKFPKIQILTIADLFPGRQAELPWRELPNAAEA